jgi:subtilase family serine protease
MSNRLRLIQSGWFAVAMLLIVTIAGSVVANAGVLANSTPRFVSTAQNLGPEDPSKVISLTFHLQLHNVAQRDALLKQLYTPGSPLYHQWLTPEQYAAQFGPTASEAAVVKAFLESSGLGAVTIHQNNLQVSAEGTVADIQKAFNVQIHRFKVDGNTRYANINDPSIVGPAASYVSAIEGLHEVVMRPYLVRPVDPNTGNVIGEYPLAEAAPKAAAASASTTALYFENQCMRPVENHAWTTGGAAPTGVYSGNRYGADITNTTPGHLAPCGYEPAAIQTAYGMKAIYAKGWDGTGQTVVVVDAYGSPTAAQDLGKFSSVFSLAAPNFTSVNYPIGTTPAYNSGWAGETTLDIEWVHAMAPGAKIVLMQARTSSNTYLEGAIQYALNNHLGNVITNSYGSVEYGSSSSSLNTWNNLLAQAALQGVSVNFSTGDAGDNSHASPYVKTVSVPSDSPNATAVGGVSVFLNSNLGIKFQAGWGTDLTRIAEPNGTAPDAPPICAVSLLPLPNKCFDYGAGGGMSTFFAKPTWQSALPGTGRQQPDISLVADPYTGVTIISSYPAGTSYSVSVIGGTSASCPMFSGVWAIVDQAVQAKAGKSAGLAAPLMYSLPANAITDVLPSSSSTTTNLAGLIVAGGVPTYESPVALITPDVPTSFTSAFYNSPSSLRWFAISFGTDSSLVVTPGWDNVTGMGTPNGLNFVNAVLSKF